MTNIVFDETQDSVPDTETTLRTIGVSDLLGIKSHTISEGVLNFFVGTTVLVTGAGGTVGGALAVVLASRVSKLILVESHEPSLARIVQRVKAVSPTITVVPSLANLKNEKSIRALLAEHTPTYVFHTAAFKHVDIAESNPLEAIHNNFVASVMLADACAQAQVHHFAFTSSDKAVYPNNLLGASKRAVERYLLTTDTAMHTTSVRFVNVVGSSGSVVKVFENQINRFGTVTVTNPNMERYIMSVADAVYLTLSAMAETAACDDKRQLYMLDSGKPVLIKDIAQRMIDFSGKDVQITYTNVRPGEKINEDLLYSYEAFERSDEKNVMRISFDRTYVHPIDLGEVRLLKAAIKSLDADSEEVLSAFLKMVPEYKK